MKNQKMWDAFGDDNFSPLMTKTANVESAVGFPWDDSDLMPQVKSEEPGSTGCLFGRVWNNPESLLLDIY